ncbi:hypothetical protein EMPS_08319 [Entomortierella parvispora]|uniref:Major facilitator superfamily (MFS) profile domain-containing protein n=1 Tax=Entomortierella parvispora TaxID=205924 RepID=A0A9P3HG42_9FUNG|nr:hypothetical protein EMPS_08319 [Entomortierella parvispora]
MSEHQPTDQKATTPGQSPIPLKHEDSDLTIGQVDEKTEVDVEKASAFDPSEEPVLVDGPLYGWVIVFASFVSQMISMGICNVYGVYQSFYLSNTFNGTANSFELAWIGSLTIVALDLGGPFTGSICDHFGHRGSALVGVVIMTLALVAAAFSTKVWMLYLTQGLLYGGGSSLVYFASLSLPSQWFKANRGLVTGISISGGGIGGLWLSPLISKFLETKGLRWTLLCTAIAQFVILIPVCMLFRTRVESGVQRAKRIQKFGYRKGESLEQDKQRKMIDFSIFKNTRFTLLFVAGIAVVSAYFSPFYYINSYAVQHGVDSSTAALMVGLMNGASAVGRIVMGFASDKMGAINALFISTFLASLSILFIWTFAKTVSVMMVFSILYGLCCGAYLSSTVSVTGAICGQERLATVAGIIYAGMAIGSLIGSPVSGAILDSVGHKTDYTGVILWTGIMMSIGTAILLALRIVTSRSVFARV